MQWRLTAFVFVFCVSLGLGACGDDNGGTQQAGESPTPAETPVEGVDLSGNYGFRQLECFDQGNGEPTLIAEFSDYSETVQISGNQFSRTVRGGNCSATLSGRIVFGEDGSFTAGETSVSAPGGDCSSTTDLVPTDGSNTGTQTFEISFTNGETLPGSSGRYVRNTESGAVGIEETETEFLAGSDCFFVYLPQ